MKDILQDVVLITGVLWFIYLKVQDLYKTHKSDKLTKGINQDSDKIAKQQSLIDADKKLADKALKDYEDSK